MLILNFVMNQTKNRLYSGKTCHSYWLQDAASLRQDGVFLHHFTKHRGYFGFIYTQNSGRQGHVNGILTYQKTVFEDAKGRL